MQKKKYTFEKFRDKLSLNIYPYNFCIIWIFHGKIKVLFISSKNEKYHIKIKNNFYVSFWCEKKVEFTIGEKFNRLDDRLDRDKF